MTAGESATPDFDFESIVYGSGIIDPGMTEHLQTIVAYERALNGEGGKSSVEYDSILRLLNESWPQHGASAEVSGRLYLFGDIIDTDVANRASNEWGQPLHHGGITYWDIAGAELVSRGIVDDGDEQEVRLVCAYSFEDDAVPSFTMRPNESTATYERLTRQGCEQYLRREWPELIEMIDQGLPDRLLNVEDILRLAITVANEYQDVLTAYDDLRPALSEYITYRAGFSNNAPYAFVLEGELHYFDEQENRTTLRLPERTLEYLYRPTIVFQDINNIVSVGIVASSGEGVDDDILLIIPADAIQEFRPTHTDVSLLDRVGRVDNFHTGVGRVEIAEQEEYTFREERLEHLRNLQTEILHMIEQARQITTEGCDTPEEALEIAQSRLYEIQSRANAIGLNECTLVVEGEAITLPPSQYEFNRSSEGPLSINAIGEAAFMELGDQRTGHYSDIQASYRIMEDDGEIVYYPSITMRLLVASHSEETMYANELAMTEVIVNSHAHVPLESATIIVERLHAEELIDQTLIDIDREGEEDVCGWLESIYVEFFDPDIDELSHEALDALHKVTDFCDGHANEMIVKAITAVIDGMFNNQDLAINTTKDKHELVAGVIIDVKFERSPDFPPEGLVLTLAGSDGSLHNIAAEGIKTIVPRRDL